MRLYVTKCSDILCITHDIEDDTFSYSLYYKGDENFQNLRPHGARALHSAVTVHRTVVKESGVMSGSMTDDVWACAVKEERGTGGT